MLRCPRCGHDLMEYGPTLEFCRWFECPSCTIAWSFFFGIGAPVLVQGKKPKKGLDNDHGHV